MKFGLKYQNICFQAACDLAQDIEYAEATLATFERAKTAFQRVMLDVTTNDIDLEVRDTVADIARGLRSLKVKKNANKILN